VVKPSVLNIDYQKTIDAPHYPIESGKIIENIKEYSIKNGIHYQVRKNGKTFACVRKTDT